MFNFNEIAMMWMANDAFEKTMGRRAKHAVEALEAITESAKVHMVQMHPKDQARIDGQTTIDEAERLIEKLKRERPNTPGATI